MNDVLPKRGSTRGAGPLPARFAFGGAVGDVLRRYFDRDVDQARLSTKFKLYYRLRPVIPIALRRLLQRGRAQGINVPTHWARPDDFVADLCETLESERDMQVIHPWPDGFGMSSVLTHDIETADGAAMVDQVAALEEERGFRSAWYFIPYKYRLDWGLLADLKARGHEIGVHGYNHDGRLFESHRQFSRRVIPINGALQDFGSDGFRAPMVHRNLEWLQELDIKYDASCFDVDPFQAMPGGVRSPWPLTVGKFVELPYTLPQDHTVLITLGETTPRIWIEKLAYLRQLAGMALMITHPDYLDPSSRLNVYRDYLEHLVEQKNVWHALPHEVAAWWRERDELKIVAGDSAPRLSGSAAGRARLVLLHDLLHGVTVSDDCID